MQTLFTSPFQPVGRKLRLDNYTCIDGSTEDFGRKSVQWGRVGTFAHPTGYKGLTQALIL